MTASVLKTVWSKNSHQGCSVRNKKKGVLGSFGNFMGKALVLGSLFNELPTLGFESLLKRDFGSGVFL